MGLKRKIKDALDRPRFRWLLMPLATGRIILKEREPCLVWPIDGGWMHWFASGRFAGGDIGGARPPRELDRHAQEIFLYGCALRPGDTVLDIGAGAGEEVRTFSRLVGSSGRVVAVEAHPLTFSLLERNCPPSNFPNVELIHRAVADRPGVAHLTNEGAAVGNRVLQSGTSVAVAASALDDLATELDIGRVALIKMNIEGSERLAINGMRTLIQRTDNVCISCHDFLASSNGDETMKTHEVVRTFLQEQGFHIQTREQDPRPWVRFYLYGSRVPA